MDDQSLVDYAQPLYNTVKRNGNKRFVSKRSKPPPENDDQVHPPLMNEERRIEDDSSIHDQDRLNIPFVSFGSDAETTAKAASPSAELLEPMASLFDDDSLAQLLADFDAQLTQTMLSLDEAEKSIEEESNKQQKQKQKKDKRMNGATKEQPNTSGDQNIVDEGNKQRRKDQQQQEEPLSFEVLASSPFDRNAPTFSSFKGTPPIFQKKMVTFDDPIQTFVRPQSMHESELSYNDANDDGHNQLHQQQQQQQQQLPHQQQLVTKKEDAGKEATRDGEDAQRDRQSRHDVQSQQPVNESGIYEDVYARQNNSPVANNDIIRYDAIPTGNKPVDSRVKVKVKTSTAVFYDRQVPDEDVLAAAADGNDEFLSLGSEDDEEDEDDDEDTDCMIRETNIKSPLTKVKALTVCRTLAVILAWLLAGIVAELPGPTMKYWSEWFSVSEEQLSRVLATDGLGIVLGSLLGGAASCRRHSDSVLAVAMVMLACYPCTYSYPYYQLTAFLCAVARGTIFVGGMSVVFEMWQESRAAIWVHILHTAYSVGCFSAVHLATPFVQYLFQVDGRFLWSDPSGQGFPPLAVHMAYMDAGNTTADAGEMMEMLISSDTSQQSSPISSTSSAAAAGRIPIRLHLLQIPFAIICLLLSLFFLCNSILRTMKSLRRRNIRRKKRLQRQKNRNRHLKKEMPDPEQRNENLYEDTLNDKKTDKETDEDKVSNTTGNRQPEVDKNGVESKKNGYTRGKNGFLNGAFAHAPGQEFRTAESKGDSRNASSRGCDEQPSDYKGTPKRTRPKSEATKEHVPWFQGDQTFDVPILMFLYVCFVFPFGLEAALGMFLSVYASTNNALQQQQQQQQQLESAADDAALDIDVTVQLLSVFWASFILGRILSASLSRILSAGALLIVCLTINVLSSAILSAYADKYSTILWLFVAIFGGFLGPFIPGGFTWANVFLVATPKSIALAYCSAGLGWAICCWLAGFLVSYFGSNSLMYLVAAVSSLSVLLFIPVLMKLGAPGSRQRKRPVRKPLSTYV